MKRSCSQQTSATAPAQRFNFLAMPTETIQTSTRWRYTSQHGRSSPNASAPDVRLRRNHRHQDRWGRVLHGFLSTACAHHADTSPEFRSYYSDCKKPPDALQAYRQCEVSECATNFRAKWKRQRERYSQSRPAQSGRKKATYQPAST